MLQTERTATGSAKYLRMAMVALFVLLVGVETTDFDLRNPDVFDIAEILIYLILLAGLGFWVVALTRVHQVQTAGKDRMKFTTVIIQKIETWVIKSAKYFRVAIAVTLVLLVGLETAEFQFRISDTFHVGEIIIYFVLLGAMGLLFEVIVQAQKKQQRSMNILNYKHKMSLEALPHQSWEALTTLLTQQLAELMDAKAAYLFFNKPLSDECEPVAEWVEAGFGSNPLLKLDCLICVKENAAKMLKPHFCDLSIDPKNNQEFPSYCYPIFYKDELYALFRFVLKPGSGVTEEKQEILTNVSDEVIISLMAGQDRKRLSELEVTETALAERHAMSHYLHDNLGQNLGYLRMKLEQFVDQPELPVNGNGFKTELMRMRDVADESYRFVRNKLEVTIPDSTPLLTNYLQEHAKKVALRSKIDIEFIKQGTAKAVPVDLQRAVFFVFQETLSNVEKHSHASRVNVLLDWDADHLSIAVTDNGVGFDVDSVAGHQHFGLEIMRERMMGIGGTVEIQSSRYTGTTITLSAPIPVGSKLRGAS